MADTVTNAILFRRFNSSGYSPLAPESVLQNEVGNMGYDQCSDSDDEGLLYGNAPGVELLKNNKTNTNEINNLKKDFADFKKQMEDSSEAKNIRLEAQDERISSQEKDIEALKEASVGFEAVRHRWVDNFRRHELRLPGLRWRPIGNKVAHVVADARLWNLNQRNDQHVTLSRILSIIFISEEVGQL